MPEKLDFPTGRGNNIHIIIYVPSTIGIDKKISKEQFDKRIKSVIDFLRDKFGGSTKIKASGDYYSDELKKPVKERVAKVEAFTTKRDYYKADKEIRKFLKEKKKSWSQEAISYEYEESLYFV